MAFCPNCGAQLTAGANNCAACGKPVGQSAGGGVAAAPAQAASAGGLQDNVAGMLAYISVNGATLPTGAASAAADAGLLYTPPPPAPPRSFPPAPPVGRSVAGLSTFSVSTGTFGTPSPLVRHQIS